MKPSREDRREEVFRPCAALGRDHDSLGMRIFRIKGGAFAIVREILAGWISCNMPMRMR